MNATRSLTPSSGLPPDRATLQQDARLFDADPRDEAGDAESFEAAVRADDFHAARAVPATAVSEERLAQWIDAIVDHDERALSALYDATMSRVYGLVMRIVHRPALAAEVVEDTYFQVWRQAARYDAERGRPMTWLLGMARSRAIDTLRHEKRFNHDPLDADAAHETAAPQPAADDLLDVARSHAALHSALMQLQAQPRQLVALAFLRGLSHEEIACETALPLGTVKSQIRRALLVLRQALNDDGLGALVT